MPSRNSTVKSLNLRIVALQRQVTAANEDRNAAFQKALVLADALFEVYKNYTQKECDCPFCGQEDYNEHTPGCVMRIVLPLMEHRRKPCG